MDPRVVDALWGARPWDESDRGPNDFVSRVLQPLAALLVLISLIGALGSRPWDQAHGSSRGGSRTQAKVHNGGIYACRPVENDGTVPLDDVDYVCNPQNKPILSGYWIGTDGDSITDLLPNG
jgi:hypothetical protein